MSTVITTKHHVAFITRNRAAESATVAIWTRGEDGKRQRVMTFETAGLGAAKAARKAMAKLDPESFTRANAGAGD